MSVGTPDGPDSMPDDINEPAPREASTIETHELDRALRGLAFLGEDTFLGMQATNIAIVDSFLMPLETEMRGYRGRDSERPDIGAALFLNAQSQMWMFAVYELVRTWRERSKNIVKWAANGGLIMKAEALEKDMAFPHFGRMSLAGQLRRIAADPDILDAIRDDLARTHVPFGQLEFLRVALTKHEVSGKAKMMAYAPGYARVDTWTGSMSYELSIGNAVLGEITRRSVADAFRSIAVDRCVPMPDDLANYDAAMKPPVEMLAEWTRSESDPFSP